VKLRGLPISLKLVLLSAGATALVVSATFLALRARVDADIRREFATELDAGQQAIRNQQDRNLRLLLATSSLVSTSPTLRAALQTWRVETNAGLPSRPDLLATIQREVGVIFADLDHEMLAVTDETGNVLAAAVREGTPRPRNNLFDLPAVRHALIADTITADSSFGVLTSDRAAASVPLQVGCVAIMVGGYPIGVLVLGKRLDRLLPEITEAPGTHAIVTAGDEVLLSTTPATAPGSRWTRTAGSEPAWRARLGDDEYVGTSLPIGLADNGTQAQMHLMRSLSASVVPITNALRGSFLLFGILAVLVAGAGAALVTRNSLRPLARFVGFMRSGADTGAYARYSDPTAPAEIATLTEAYNHLIDSLSQGNKQLRASQEQLRQSQKLEAVGTLAGGIAHDFNNLLSVIMGYTQLSLDELPADHPVRADLEDIARASERAHGLVRQLLAFSRKQVLQPHLLDLNEVMRGLGSLMKPLIGEDIEVRMKLAPQVSRIMADRGQIEQVMVNLVVNARDAMPTGGVITIETSDVNLADPVREDMLPGGPAVMVAVSDSGRGMDAAVRERIFEPFFTTKEAGKGTGLGLSTVYGIIKQSGGNITVYSEPGEGTTFRMYFPVAANADAVADAETDSADTSKGHETVLLAEDDAQLRALVRRCLVSRGYIVLEAKHGEEALEIAQNHAGPIHLLLTDVVMPNTSGRALAERLMVDRPDMRVLFMSGHSDEAVARHGVLTSTSAFLQKPVLPDALGRIVREVLDADPPAAKP
jgi:signal transduction histidine kinase/CheY-like chemotaxis protein